MIGTTLKRAQTEIGEIRNEILLYNHEHVIYVILRLTCNLIAQNGTTQEEMIPIAEQNKGILVVPPLSIQMNNK